MSPVPIVMSRMEKHRRAVAVILESLLREMLYGDAKWRGDTHDASHTLMDWVTIMKGELWEVERAWLKSANGNADALRELLQAVHVGVKALMLLGVYERDFQTDFQILLSRDKGTEHEEFTNALFREVMVSSHRVHEEPVMTPLRRRIEGMGMGEVSLIPHIPIDPEEPQPSLLTMMQTVSAVTQEPVTSMGSWTYEHLHREYRKAKGVS